MSEETRQESSFALQAVIAIAYGLIAGFFLAVLYWLTDDMAAAYFGQATDVVLLFLQAALNRAVLAGLVTFLLVEGLLFWLKRNVPSFSQKAQAVFVHRQPTIEVVVYLFGLLQVGIVVGKSLAKTHVGVQLSLVEKAS